MELDNHRDVVREPVVYVVDDDAAVRNSTALLMRAAGLPVQTFESGQHFLEHITADAAGCILVDISMPGMSGIDLISELRNREIHLPVIIVSGTGTIFLAVQGMKLGVVDFFEKPVDPDKLITQIRAALDIDDRRRKEAAKLAPIKDRLDSLTPRERELVKLLATGLSNKQIAIKLKISIKTVDAHRTRLMRKTGALNVADLIRMSMLAGVAE